MGYITEPIPLILSALTIGERATSEVIKNTYRDLKLLIQ